MKKIITILILFISAKCFSQTENNFMQKNTFWDSVYFKAIQYSASAGIVHLGIDTLITSPTFGKLVRKTASGFTNLTSFVSQNNWKTFYSDGSGDVQELTIGSSGKVLTSNGTSSVPSWETPSTGVTTMAAIGASPNANGATISGSTLNLEPANASFGGVVTTGTQTFAGNKTFNGTVIISGTTGSRLDVSTSSTGFTNRAARFIRFPATSTGVETAFEVARQNNSGNGADGIGVSIDFYNEAADGNHLESSRLISVSRNATSRNTQFSITNAINGSTDTSIAVGDYVTLTESSATKFTSTAIANSKIQGGSILVTIEANDATDYQSRTLRFIWSAVNKAGTLTITISTPEEVVALSSGTLTCTITAVDAGSGVLDFKANAVSSLTQTTLRATYQTFKNF